MKEFKKKKKKTKKKQQVWLDNWEYNISSKLPEKRKREDPQKQ